LTDTKTLHSDDPSTQFFTGRMPFLPANQQHWRQ